MTVDTYYLELCQKRSALVSQCIADTPTFASHVASHNSLKDFEAMLAVLSEPEASIFRQGCREYQYALEAIITGNYRHAFASLRLSFELLLGSIYFSAHQLSMRLWIAGHDDLHWAQINDVNRGVFSHNFVRAFAPEFGRYRSQYLTLSNTVYREASEYVHGNPTTNEDVSEPITYKADRLTAFHDKVETVRLCVAFAFAIRYLPSLGPDDKGGLEALMLESFGDLPEIQAIFAKVS